MSITVFLTYPPQTYDTEEDSFLIPPPAASERNCDQIPPNILTPILQKDKKTS